MKDIILLIVGTLLFSPYLWAADPMPRNVDEAIALLDRIIDNQDAYTAARHAELDSLKHLLVTTPQPAVRLELLQRLGDRYYDFQVDSALAYYKRGISLSRAIGDDAKAQLLDIRYISLLPVSGAVKEGLDAFEAMQGDSIYPANRAEFLESGSRLYFFSVDYYKSDSMKQCYADRAMDLSAGLLDILDRESPGYHYYRELKRYFREGKASIAVATLTDVLSTMSPLDPYYSRIALTIAHYYDTNGDPEQEIYYLALAAIADAMSATHEESALLTLGERLYHRGDPDRAYRYIIHALSNSVASGAATRSVMASRILPIIAADDDAQEARRLNALIVLIGVLIAAILVVAIVLYFLLREHRRLKSSRRDLAHELETKELYISEFLNLSSIHLDHMEELRRLVVRKIKAQQTADLLQYLTSDRIKNDNQQVFFNIFDDAFNHMYPQFIDGVNALLLPDKQIKRPQGAALNTELRILALMRLGIDDSGRIAKFLGVSINTIYTYRNKFRASAIDRSTFEASLMKIHRAVADDDTPAEV